MPFTAASMLARLVSVSALLAGLGIVLTGSGLLGTFLPIRAGQEGFGDVAIGIVQSAYYVGFVGGTVLCSRIIRRVGNIRAFAIFAAVATVSILAHAVFVNVLVWTLLRALVGASLIGIYITVESWLNARADRSNRGRILAAYEVVGLTALAAGQFLIAVGDPSGPLPFLIAASLFAAGLIPVALTRLPEPDLGLRGRLTVRTLFAVSPVAVVGTLAGATAAGAFFGLGPLYAQKIGLASAEIAAYMSAALIGGALLQWPIGALSDRMDRRIVISINAALAGVAALGIVTVGGTGIVPLIVATFLYGGTMLVLYSLCVAHANDVLPQAQFLDAARGFNFLYGVGAAAAPAAVGALMARFGPASLFLVSALLLLALAAFALMRVLTTRVVAVEAREEFVAVASQCTEALELHPHKPLESVPGDATGG